MESQKFVDNKEAEADINRAWQEIDCRKLLAHTSHDLRSSLNNMLGLTELAKSQLDDKEYVGYCLERMEDTTHFLLNLVNDIMYTISPADNDKGNVPGRNSTINIRELFEMVANSMRPMAHEKKLHFHTQIDDNVTSYVKTDRGRIRQILQNLLSNSVKFTPRYGKIDFQLHQLAEYDDKARMEFIVRDTGVGIAPELQKHIFWPLSADDTNRIAAYGGAGLGLAICYKLVDYLGGRLEFRSVKGKGTEFKLHLDLEIDREMLEHIQPVKNNGYQFAGKVVLLAEDDRLNSEIAKSLLSRRGMIVDIAENGQIAVNKFMMNPPKTYDAILMDVRMPLMNGWDAARMIRTSGKSDAKLVPIIAMTASAEEKDFQMSAQAGMDAHLVKPVESNLLYETLQQALNGEL